MDSRSNASIDVENLADSLSENLETLPYLSCEEHCIYRVPQSHRSLHPNDYTPQIISIGPFHHGKVEFKAMEENKRRYLRYFLQRTKVTMAGFLAFIKENETKLRNCYAETIHFESDEFVTMILIDAVFLIELFLRKFNRSLRTADDPLFRISRGMSYLGDEMRYDLFLSENQIPLFILNELFHLAYGDNYGGNSFVDIISFYFTVDPYLPISDGNLIGDNISKAKHFVDLLILCLQPPQSATRTEINFQNLPSVKELHHAGVKFRSGARKYPLNITFNKGKLEIPIFHVFGSTERLYRNLLIYEMTHYYPIACFNDYLIIMYYFVGTPNDADLLIRNGIGLGDGETMSTVFNSLFKDCGKGSHLRYGNLVKDIQAYRRSPWNKWKANLTQNYFNTPWASISVIAAVILLLLTITQTICALIAL